MGFSATIQEQIRDVQDRCETYSSAIENRAWASSTDALPPLSERVSDVFSQEEGRGQESGPDGTEIRNTFAGTILSSSVSIAQGLDSMVESSGFLQSASGIVQSKEKPGEPDPEISGGSSASPFDLLKKDDPQPFEPRRGSITRDLVAAAKASLAALIAYVYLNTVDWPGGITAVVTAVLVSLDSYGAMIQKSALRVAGAAIGGLASVLVILLVIPNITSLPPFLVAAGLVCALGAWVQTGSTRIAYAGLQIGLVVGLALASSHSPSIDLMPFRDRILGIFTGLLSVLLVYGLFGEIRARIWALDNSAETLRLMAKGALIGLRGADLKTEIASTYDLRSEVYRRISFGYRLLTEASYEDWFSRHKEKNKQETDALHTVLDDTRAIQRVIMSIVWNRLEFQKLSATHSAGQDALEAVGRTIPEIQGSLAHRLENSKSSDSTALESMTGYSEKLRSAESVLQGERLTDSATPLERNYHRLLRAQLGFYQQLEILLSRLARNTQELSITGDQFSLLARLRGSERRRGAPTIRPV